jgi:hypothetical protein
MAAGRMYCATGCKTRLGGAAAGRVHLAAVGAEDRRLRAAGAGGGCAATAPHRRFRDGLHPPARRNESKEHAR